MKVCAVSLTVWIHPKMVEIFPSHQAKKRRWLASHFVFAGRPKGSIFMR